MAVRSRKESRIGTPTFLAAPRFNLAIQVALLSLNFAGFLFFSQSVWVAPSSAPTRASLRSCSSSPHRDRRKIKRSAKEGDRASSLENRRKYPTRRGSVRWGSQSPSKKCYVPHYSFLSSEFFGVGNDLCSYSIKSGEQCCTSNSIPH